MFRNQPRTDNQEYACNRPGNDRWRTSSLDVANNAAGNRENSKDEEIDFRRSEHSGNRYANAVALSRGDRASSKSLGPVIVSPRPGRNRKIANMNTLSHL